MRHLPTEPRSCRSLATLAALLAGLLLVPSPLLGDEPLSRDQLQKLVDQKVDTQLIVAVVKRNCVSFAIDGNTLAGLAASLPKPVLEAAIECKAQPAARPATAQMAVTALCSSPQRRSTAPRSSCPTT